ncbi:hypothetical protein MSBR3_0674 [Methanosarcina barkeri 3]|uniref:DUF2795 domain-containing protein n=1 Tax=Methanosarcina barkeri 3 TaxID=1434107 RepID=A0A0E3SK69_METBA|nr:DUF2795 domain-containing protein [Methanosarcina barkeri]AKB81252.1 hypothetical protein MSBR3_0674 [Methanosarcina barkeri 3]
METGSQGKNIEEKLPMETEKVLAKVNFPAKKSDIIEEARKQGVQDSILENLGMLPDREYKSIDDVRQERTRR